MDLEAGDYVLYLSLVDIETGESLLMDNGDEIFSIPITLESPQTVKPDIRLDCVPFLGVLHLKSGLTEIAPNVLLHDPALKLDYALDWASVVELPPAEGYGADVMPVNDAIFICIGFPTVRETAQKYYDTIIELDMSEFQKMDGALTCLSLRY